jgi:biotin-(acetyl-CoA carboxylase) ligase
MAVSVAVNVRGVEVLAQPGVLALLAGLGALRAVRSQHCTPEALGMKWPNDIVERSSGRKLGGVLIEQFGMLAVIGVGVNVLQRAANFPPELGDSAISILESDVAGGMQSGRVLKREDVAAAVVREVAAGLVQVCAEDGIEKLEREFAAADVLQGTTQTLVCDGLSYRGRVLSVEPLKQITIVTGQGTRVLPATKTQVERFQRPVKTGKLR